MLLTCRQTGQLCAHARWSPHTLVSHPPASRFEAGYQMHLGYGSGDCSIASCNVESPWPLSTLVPTSLQHMITHSHSLSAKYHILFHVIFKWLQCF
jgi:hypothetical protein